MRGAPAGVVERALASGDPLPGTTGFAGALPDGRLARDVLGRVPLFLDADDETWSHDPADLDDAQPFPAGRVGRPGADPERAWTLPAPGPDPDRERAVERVREAVERALGTVPADGTAVAFSGGVDSALVASALDAPLYVVGFEGSRDVEAARDAARLMGREDDLHAVELTLDDVEAAVPRVARATGRTDAMDVSIGLPLFLAAERAAEDGHARLAVGQGADELFGGYEKVVRAPGDPRVEADTVRGARREVLSTLPDQLPRDALAIRAGGVDPVAPLLDDRVVSAALALPESLLVDADADERKVALRLAARARLPGRVAAREKVAVQYGSLVARELDRLARRAGFKRRTDDHVSKYVDSRLD